MFSLYIIHDMVEIEPVYFLKRFGLSTSPFSLVSPALANKPSDRDVEHLAVSHAAYTVTQIIRHRLTERYVGRVAPRCGFCVAIREILEHSSIEVKGPSASAWLGAVFEAVMFSPKPGTRLRARIVQQTPEALHLKLDFCSAFPVLVPADQLVLGSKYDANQAAWYISVDPDEASGAIDTPPSQNREQENRNYYRIGEEVIARVTACIMHDDEKDLNLNVATSAKGLEEPLSDDSAPLMSLFGSFLGDLLGPTCWYDEV